MEKKLINEDITNMKYLFGYKPGKVISEQIHPDMIKGKPERLVKDVETGKVVGTYKRGVGFYPSSYGEELGYEYQPTSIPHGTKLAGIEVGDFDYEDDDFSSQFE